VPRSQRTTKSVAKRIDLNYFKRPHPLRRLRFILSIAALALAVVWLAGFGLARNSFVYTAGKVSPAHAVVSRKCFACHIERAGKFRETAIDRGCLSCHDGPIHHANQIFTPKCGSCHVEHRGQIRLAAAATESCTQCHADLETAGTPTTFYRHITGFGAGHPEFAVLRSGEPDPGTIKLNHFVHLKAGLKGPHGEPVQLDCEDCHRANQANQQWAYAIGPDAPPGETPKLPAAVTASLSPYRIKPPTMVGARAYMGPILYARQCAACHPLQFDKRFTESVPHDTPEIVHAYLVKKFSDYIAAHPAELREPISTVALPAKPVPVSPRVYSPPEQWVNAKVADAEALLWGKTCKQCHTMLAAQAAPAAQPSLPALPKVAESKITARWFPHAMFDHNQHRLVTCESCHVRARTSQNTADVLVPSVHVCAECHHTGSAGAESRCFECHIYHDWRNEKEVTSRFPLADIVGGAKRPGDEENSSGGAK